MEKRLEDITLEFDAGRVTYNKDELLEYYQDTIDNLIENIKDNPFQAEKYGREIAEYHTKLICLKWGSVENYEENKDSCNYL